MESETMTQATKVALQQVAEHVGVFYEKAVPITINRLYEKLTARRPRGDQMWPSGCPVVTLKASTGHPEGILWAYSSSPVVTMGHLQSARPQTPPPRGRLADGHQPGHAPACRPQPAPPPALVGAFVARASGRGFRGRATNLGYSQYLVDETWMTSQQYDAFDVYRLMFVSPHATFDP